MVTERRMKQVVFGIWFISSFHVYHIFIGANLETGTQCTKMDTYNSIDILLAEIVTPISMVLLSVLYGQILLEWHRRTRMPLHMCKLVAMVTPTLTLRACANSNRNPNESEINNYKIPIDFDTKVTEKTNNLAANQEFLNKESTKFDLAEGSMVPVASNSCSVVLQVNNDAEGVTCNNHNNSNSATVESPASSEEQIDQLMQSQDSTFDKFQMEQSLLNHNNNNTLTVPDSHLTTTETITGPINTHRSASFIVQQRRRPSIRSQTLMTLLVFPSIWLVFIAVPFFIFVYEFAGDSESAMSRTLQKVACWLVVFSYCSNPLFYCVTHAGLRKKFMKIFS